MPQTWKYKIVNTSLSALNMTSKRRQKQTAIHHWSILFIKNFMLSASRPPDRCRQVTSLVLGASYRARCPGSCQVVNSFPGKKSGKVGRLQITIATIHHLVTTSVIAMLRYVTKHFIPNFVVNSGHLQSYSTHNDRWIMGKHHSCYARTLCLVCSAVRLEQIGYNEAASWFCNRKTARSGLTQWYFLPRQKELLPSPCESFDAMTISTVHILDSYTSICTGVSTYIPWYHVISSQHILWTYHILCHCPFPVVPTNDLFSSTFGQKFLAMLHTAFHGGEPPRLWFCGCKMTDLNNSGPRIWASPR